MASKTELPGSDAIATLVWGILQPAIAGGMTEERAQKIYEDIMFNIASLGTCSTGQTAFEDLRDNLLERWAMHYIKPQSSAAN